MDSQVEERIELLHRIASKGGLMSLAAEYCIKNERGFDGSKFLIECYEQCDVSGARKFWGIELINDIVIYNIKYNGKKDIREA